VATLERHSSIVNKAAFSPDGQRIVTASWDHTARVWNTASGQLVAKLAGHSNFVIHAAFSPDGQHIVTASTDRTSRVWKIITLGEVVDLLRDSNYCNAVLRTREWVLRLNRRY